jgi:hypothetical protein
MIVFQIEWSRTSRRTWQSFPRIACVLVRSSARKSLSRCSEALPLRALGKYFHKRPLVEFPSSRPCSSYHVIFACLVSSHSGGAVAYGIVWSNDPGTIGRCLFVRCQWPFLLIKLWGSVCSCGGMGGFLYLHGHKSVSHIDLEDGHVLFAQCRHDLEL